MRRFIASVVSFFLCVGIVHAQFNGGFGTPGFVSSKSSTTGSGYQGPGDLKTFKVWWGVRGYSAAYAAPGTNPAIDVVDTATGGFSCTVPIATSGALDLASNVCVGNTVNIVTFCTVTHAAGCSVTKMYDQTGGGNYMQNPSLSTMPILTFNVFGSIPSVTFTSANNVRMTNPPSVNFSQSQPMMFSAVAIATTDGNRAIIGDSGGGLIVGFSLGTLKPHLYGGTNDEQTASTTANTKSALNYVLNGASSAVRLNGATTNYGATPGTFVITSGSTLMEVGDDAFGEFFDGNIAELGIEAYTAGDESTIETNQRGYYGF
jgi:hypothetical protein